MPHPPGYPVYILIAKAVSAVVPSEATALGLVSVAAGEKSTAPRSRGRRFQDRLGRLLDIVSGPPSER